jgi:hypothetical protein
MLKRVRWIAIVSAAVGLALAAYSAVFLSSAAAILFILWVATVAMVAGGSWLIRGHHA